MQITKSLASAANPLRYEPIAGQTPNTQYAGYTLRTSLTWDDGNEDGRVSRRFVESGTDAARRRPFDSHARLHRAQDLFRPNRRRTDLIVDEHLVRYRMRAAGAHKLGVRAVSVTGRVGYLHDCGNGRWSLIIRNFFVNPSGEYVDVPWGDTEDMGYSTQACNVNNEMGSFSELEYHVPAIGRATGRNSCEDAAAVWAFRGPLDEIRLIGQTLLTADVY